jgi:hypothetical protein
MPARDDRTNEPPETARIFMRELHALAYRSLGCRYDIRFAVNAKGHYVVAILWGNDPSLPMEPAVAVAVRNMGLK